MSKAIGLGGGPNGRNEKYKIKGKVFTRKQAVNICKKGLLPGTHIVTINGEDYLRDNPDHTIRDNVNRNKKR